LKHKLPPHIQKAKISRLPIEKDQKSDVFLELGGRDTTHVTHSLFIHPSREFAYVSVGDIRLFGKPQWGVPWCWAIGRDDISLGEINAPPGPDPTHMCPVRI